MVSGGSTSAAHSGSPIPTTARSSGAQASFANRRERALLAACADLRVAGPGTRFKITAMSYGYPGLSWILADLIGKAHRRRADRQPVPRAHPEPVYRVQSKETGEPGTVPAGHQDHLVVVMPADLRAYRSVQLPLTGDDAERVAACLL
jgi:hypothetical protein